MPRKTRNGVRLWRAGQGRSAGRVGAAGRGSPPASPGPCTRLLFTFSQNPLYTVRTTYSEFMSKGRTNSVFSSINVIDLDVLNKVAPRSDRVQ